MKIVEIKIANSDDCLRALQATEKECGESGLNRMPTSGSGFWQKSSWA
ncbi:MAG: hypothetical protein IKP61_05135 [Spirochaetales bacterium]|nr:hypothetical protein [Spirochaetales bacterium]